MSNKTRLDTRVFELGLTESREKAKAFIMAGQVYVNGMKAVKPGAEVLPEDKIEVRAQSEFVSRGGYKLKKAVASFSLRLDGKVCMDVGASTGGFTDCMLQNGASRVYSVDVGYGQLAWKIRNNPKVVNLERTNVRYITANEVPDRIDFVSVDVSFISLCLVLPAVYPLIADNGECVCLIKPQFEAGRSNVGKKGVVRDKNVHVQVIKKVCDFACENGFDVAGLDFSPIKGPEGNIEYLAYLKKNGENHIFRGVSAKNDDFSYSDIIGKIVAESHEQLDKQTTS